MMLKNFGPIQKVHLGFDKILDSLWFILYAVIQFAFGWWLAKKIFKRIPLKNVQFNFQNGCHVVVHDFSDFCFASHDLAIQGN